MAQLKPVTTGGLLKDVNDNFAAISTVGTFAGLHLRRTAVAVFDAEGEDNPNQAVGAHALPVKLPANSIIVGGVVDVVKTFTSENDTATIAISVAQANDIVAAKAIGAEGDVWGAGLQAIVPKSNTPETTGIKLTDEKAITANVAAIDTDKPGATGFLVQVWRSGVDVTSDAVVSIPAGVLTVADGAATYNMAAGDVINWIVFEG